MKDYNSITLDELFNKIRESKSTSEIYELSNLIMNKKLVEICSEKLSLNEIKELYETKVSHFIQSYKADPGITSTISVQGYACRIPQNESERKIFNMYLDELNVYLSAYNSKMDLSKQNLEK